MADSIKGVTGEWTWFSDYASIYATWTVNCPPTRRCQVGMGVKAFGSPRGEKVEFSGTAKFFTLGVGAIHIRALGGKGICHVRLDQGDVGLIPIIDVTV